MKTEVNKLKLDDVVEFIYRSGRKVTCYCPLRSTIFIVKDQDYVLKHRRDLFTDIYTNENPLPFICKNCRSVSYLYDCNSFQGYAELKQFLNIII